jgi:cytoskeleton protein RodZ
MAVFGDTLRQARSYKGVTIREAEVATRINRHHLAALEEEKFEGLPPLIYQRGIVKNYANYLGLDPNKLLELFDGARGDQPDDPRSLTPIQQLEMPNHLAPIIAFMVFASAIVFAWLYSAYFAPTEATSTPTEFIATLTPVNAEDSFIPSPTFAAPTPTVTPQDSPTATSPPEPTATEELATTDNVDQSTQTDNSITSEPTVDGVIDEPTEAPTELAQGVASIQIHALSDITVEIVADGVSVFSGDLASGDVTDFYPGSTFVVHTSSGANTEFTNDRGEVFMMGYEEGDVTYDFSAQN